MRGLFGQTAAITAPERAEQHLTRAHDGPVYAVGDVHGHLSLYRLLEQAIIDDAPAGGLIVLLGDVVDRGPQSAAMIDHLLAPPPAGFERLCLRGNHEDMMRRFVDKPRRDRSWLAHGGAQTLASYGIGADPVRGYDMAAGPLQRLMSAHIPQTHLDFLSDLPLSLMVGRYFLAHAGIDPARPIAEQTKEDLMWSRNWTEPDLPPPADQGGLVVVQGHVPIGQVTQRGWRINVDTGAYSSGVLSAVRLSPDDPPMVFEARQGQTAKREISLD